MFCVNGPWSHPSTTYNAHLYVWTYEYELCLKDVTVHPNKALSSKFSVSSLSLVFTARKNAQQSAKITISHSISNFPIHLHLGKIFNTVLSHKPNQPTQILPAQYYENNYKKKRDWWRKVRFHCFQDYAAKKYFVMCCLSLSQLIKSKLWLTWKWFVTWHCLKDVCMNDVSLYECLNHSLSGVYLNGVTFNMLS